MGRLLLVLAGVGGWTITQALPPPPQGQPQIRFIPGDPDAHPSFTAVEQMPDGVLLVGGADGVGAFDGRRWRWMSMPNGQPVRSLRHDGQERLYIGGTGQFGYAEVAANGQLEFTDLTPALDALPEARHLADIWEILISDQGIFFRALHHVFRFQPTSGQVESWTYRDGRLGALLEYDNEVFLQFRGLGLRRFTGAGFAPVPGGQRLTSQLYALLPLPDGGWLTLARDGLWQRFVDGRLEPWSTPAKLPPSGRFGAWLVLPDGRFALGDPDGVLHILDPAKQSHRAYQVATEYISDLKYSMYGWLMVQTNRGTYLVVWPSSWLQLDSGSGLRGNLNTVVPWRDQWLVISNSGVLAIDGGAQHAELTDLTDYEAWDFLVIDPDSALLAESYDLLEVGTDGRTRSVAEELYPRLLVPSRFHPDCVLVGTEKGLAIVERIDRRWQTRFSQSDFTGRVLSIAELASGRVLASIDRQGLVLIEFDESVSSIESWRVLEPSDGVVYGLNRAALLAEMGHDGIVASTEAGLFVWDRTRFYPHDWHDLNRFRRPNRTYQLGQAANGMRFAYAHDHLLLGSPGQPWRSFQAATLDLSTVDSVSAWPERPLMIGGLAKLMMYDPEPAAFVARAPHVALRAVRIIDSKGQESLLPLKVEQLELPADTDSIAFEFSLPDLIHPEQVRYRSRLLGFRQEFSEWGTTTRITYTSLLPGVKRFEIEGRDSLGRISATEPFEFTIRPPLYATWPARIGLIASGLVVIGLVVWRVLRWRLARVENERLRLARMVRKRTAELAAANRKLHNMANADGLTGLANRRRLDEYLETLWRRCSERRVPLAAILVDVDHFKHYNDQFGHQTGDEALRQLADILTGSVRRSEDVAARYGGEEFLILMPSADLSQATEVAEHIRSRVAESSIGVTISAGVCSLQPGPETTTEELIRHADLALYQAKANGRNRVETFRPIEPSQTPQGLPT